MEALDLPGLPEVRMMINGLVKNAVLPEPMLTQVLMNHKEARVIRTSTATGNNTKVTHRTAPGRHGGAQPVCRNYPGRFRNFTGPTPGLWTGRWPIPLVLPWLKPAQTFRPGICQSMERTHALVPGSKARADVDVYLSRLLDFSPEMVGGKLPDEKFYLSD